MKKLNYERYGSLFILILLFIISSIASPYFLQLQNILNILRQVSYTGIIALGMTFVIIGGGIDLSVGSMTALVGGIIILVLNHFGGGIGAIIISILFGLLLGIIGGTINGLLITKGRIAPFIVTLGTMAIFRSLTLYIISAGEFRSKSEIFPSIGMGSFLFIPIPIWIFIGLAIVFHIILNNKIGRAHV